MTTPFAAPPGVLLRGGPRGDGGRSRSAAFPAPGTRGEDFPAGIERRRTNGGERDDRPPIDAPRGGAGPGREWEVFVREASDEPLRHAGSVTASDADAARERAARLFGGTATDLWRCPADETRRCSARDLGGSTGREDRRPGTVTAGPEGVIAGDLCQQTPARVGRRSPVRRRRGVQRRADPTEQTTKAEAAGARPRSRPVASRTSAVSDAVPLGASAIRSPRSAPWATRSTTPDRADGSLPERTTIRPSPNRRAGSSRRGRTTAGRCRPRP